jgi:hypothetical protein
MPSIVVASFRVLVHAFHTSFWAKNKDILFNIYFAYSLLVIFLTSRLLFLEVEKNTWFYGGAAPTLLLPWIVVRVFYIESWNLPPWDAAYVSYLSL